MTSDRGPAGQNVPTSDITESTEQEFRRVLVPVVDASQAGRAAELARRVGASEVRVLHLNLHEVIGGGRRFAIETEAAASYVVEAAALGADLIVLGASRRGEFASRLFGSITLRVLRRAHCPVLVASSAGT